MKIAALVVVGFLAAAPGAGARPHSFAGHCEISGPITPSPGITVIPRPGARFSFRGDGHCEGRVDRRRVRTAPAAIDFVNVTTLFDTCELGPDFDLHGVLTIAPARRRAARFPIVLNLARLAVAGPFALRAAGGGLALGVAQFSPNDPQAALAQCGGAGGGLTRARLTAAFQTVTRLRSR